MPSQFFGLNIAYTGLLAANANLNTTGNNISNVETKGYSRQEAVQTAADALRLRTSYGMAGAGVNTEAIKQIRNEYYDLKYWDNNSSLGEYEYLKDYMIQIEDYFTETDTTPGFGTIFSEMFNGLDEVYKSSGDDATKLQFLSLSGNLCEYFNAMSTNLSKLQLDANDEIKNKTDQINSIASQIATLNKQINTIEVTGVNVVANELRDKRNLLIDELSKIVDVKVTETPIYLTESRDSKGNIAESGIYNYSVDIAGGQSLVNGYEYNTLECVARDYKVNQSDAEGLYDIVWSNGLDFNIYGRNLSGELKGLIEIRDGNNEEFFHGTSGAAGTGDNSEGETVNTIQVKVTSDYLKDMDKTTLSPDGKINIGGKVFDYTEWEFDGTDTYTFYLGKNEDGSLQNASEYVNRETKIGTSVAYQGIPYYMEQMNEWVRDFAKAMNEIELKAQDADGNACESLFTARNITDKENPYLYKDYYNWDATGKLITDANGNPVTNSAISSKGDSYYWLTAATFQVNQNMDADVGKFGTTADIYQGQDAQDITEELLKVKSDKDKMQFRGCTSEEFLQTILSDIALNTASASTFETNYTYISNSIINQRLSVSGVDNDEEALNLVKFQEAYNLAAKMIQVMTEIYDRLILSTGV